MNLKKYIKNNSILIVPTNMKNQVIKYLNSQNVMYNIKILNFEELKKYLIFDYDSESLYYLMNKNNINYQNSLELIKSMYFLFDEEYENPKINNLNNLKKELLNNNLLYKDLYFIKSLKNKEIFVYGYDYINRYNEKLLDILKKYCKITKIPKEYNNYEHIIYNFKNLNEEIEFITNDILNKKLNFNHTFIYGINKDNESTVKRIFENYNININLESNTTLFETKIGTEILNNLENYEEYVNNIKNENIKKLIIKILNKYYWAKNKVEVKNMLIEEFKNTKVPNNKYANSINEINIFDNIISDEDYVYIINFNQEYIPKIYKDEDYINDQEKFSFLESTFEKNLIEKEKWQKIIHNIKNLVITSSNQNLSGKLNPSPLIIDYGYQVKTLPFQSSIYSNKCNQYNLGIYLDEYQKFGTKNEEIDKLLATYPDHTYMTYNNKYNKIKLKDYQFNLSYSKMNAFFECPFKYYCDNILKLNKYEETFDTWLGSLCHYILSKIYEDNFNFDETKEKFINENPFNLSGENKVFLNKILIELTDAIKYIKSFSKHTKHQDIECEKNIECEIDGVKFSGIIDKIMHYDNNIVLIDYKTGNPNIDIKLANYGLNLQLPTYVFLIKQIYPNSNIIGIYLQHILKPNTNKDINKSKQEAYENNLKLAGYSLGDENYLKDFDDTYQNSEYIKGLKLTSNGFSKTSKLLSHTNFVQLEILTKNKIKECIKEIKNAKFDITPKISGTNNISCQYCPYKSICFVSEKDKMYVELDKDLTFLGGKND
jgi:hypothetical protein